MLMSKTIIAIDPGSSGYMTILKDNEYSFFAFEDLDSKEISKIISTTKDKSDNPICIIEEVHAVFGSSAAATFTFGYNVGVLHGILMANGIAYVTIQPKLWQKEVWINQDIEVKYKNTKKSTDTKKTSENCAKRLFPNIDFRKSERCKNNHDGKIDSLLICEYARRKNL